jgi:GTPase
VVDASDPLPEDQIAAVRKVLVEIGEERGGHMPPEMLVVNKTDAAGDLALARLRHLLPEAVFVSAHSGAGINRLRTVVAERLPRPEVDLELLVPYTEGGLVARMHSEGEVLSSEHVAEGTKLHVRVGPELAVAAVPYVVGGVPAVTA